MKHFTTLISMIVSNVSNEKIKFRLHQIYYQSIHLRQLLSYSVRIENFNEELRDKMKEEA